MKTTVKVMGFRGLIASSHASLHPRKIGPHGAIPSGLPETHTVQGLSMGHFIVPNRSQGMVKRDSLGINDVELDREGKQYLGQTNCKQITV